MLWLGTSGTVSPPLPFRSAPHARGRSAPSPGQAGARERPPWRGSAPRGEPEQDGGRTAAAAWAKAAATGSAESRRLGCASPGPAAQDQAQVGLPAPPPRSRSLGARPAWARGSRPPTPGPTGARRFPSIRGTPPAHRPLLVAQAAFTPRSLVPLAWKTSFPSPGPPILGSLPAYIQPWLLKDRSSPPAPCPDPAVPDPDSPLASS